VQEQLDGPLAGDYIVSLVCLEYGVLGLHALGMDHTATCDFLSDTSTLVINRIKEGTTVSGAEVNAEIMSRCWHL
jgi:hypothetical protein